MFESWLKLKYWLNLNTHFVSVTSKSIILHIFTAHHTEYDEGYVFSLSVHRGGGGAGYRSHNALQNLPTMWPCTHPPPQEVGTPPRTPPGSWNPAPYLPYPYPHTPYPPPPSHTPQPCGRYASCGHAGGLSCYKCNWYNVTVLLWLHFCTSEVNWQFLRIRFLTRVISLHVLSLQNFNHGLISRTRAQS